MGDESRLRGLIVVRSYNQCGITSEFCSLDQRIEGHGQVVVSYIREAWVTPEYNNVRLTFDRCLTATPWTGGLDVPRIHEGMHPDVGGVILELKFTGRYPNWFRELTQIFGVMQTGVAKYAEGVALADERQLSRGFAPLESEDLVEKFLSRRRPAPPN